MSNIGNYGVNPNSNVGYTTSYGNNTQTQQQNIPNGYRTDGYAFNMSPANNAPVPDVKVGLWDKITSYFDDVHRSPENLSKFKAFESAMEQNPAGYLKPGSSETGRVKDLQKKLSFVGFNVNINGEFGTATEKAVIEFKRSVGINDGYLNKNGQFAVTSIVTPEAWNILNSQVATRLNPNAAATGNFGAPVTQQEMNWAKELQYKIRNNGYSPTNQERQKYESIFQRQQMNTSIQNGSFNPASIQPPTAQELQWAKELILKMSQNGYKPSPQEQQKYSDIQNRQKIAKTNAAQPNNNVQQNNAANTGAVAPEDYNWATELMNKVKQGYKPSQQEEAKYNNIFSRYQTHGIQQAQNVNTPPSQEEMLWASQLEAKVKQGYQASPEERAKYDNIYQRYQANPANTQVANQPPAQVIKPTESELAWAMDLEKRSQQGYQPNQNELAIYNDIATRLEAFNAQQSGATPEEMAWASMMYSKMGQGYKPSSEELSILNNIQAKISGNAPVQNQQPVQDNNLPTSQEPVPDNSYVSPFQGVSEFSYNAATINAFKQAFAGVSFMGNSVPYLPPDVGAQAAQQLGFNSVEELQAAVGAGVDGKFGPETYFMAVKAMEAQQGVQANTSPGVQNNSYVQNTAPVQNNQGGVTQEELNWAVELQGKWQQGHQPSQQEISRYEDIYNRYNSAGLVSNNPAPQYNTTQVQTTQGVSQQDMQWANDLQTRWQQGYQPNQQEIARYTDIYNRVQATGNTQPTQQPVQTNSYTPSATSAPTSYVDTSSSDPDLQWALQLLEKYQQGYQPNDQELARYEQIIARNQTVAAYP